MSHYRKPLAAAAIVNSAIFVVEGVAGFHAQSSSLLMDAVHNFSDELALVFLYAAFVFSRGVSRQLLRTANLFNSVGLIGVSALLLWQVVERLLNPVPVIGAIPIAIGLLAAAANWIVARLLLEPGKAHAAIRLAYVHNIGDVWVSLAPVAAGVLVSVTQLPVFDTLVGGAVAVWFIASTGREVASSRDELVWPEKLDCGHADHDALSAG